MQCNNVQRSTAQHRGTHPGGEIKAIRIFPHFPAFFPAFSPLPGLCLPKRRCIVRLCLFTGSIHSLTGNIQFPCV